MIERPRTASALDLSFAGGAGNPVKPGDDGRRFTEHVASSIVTPAAPSPPRLHPGIEPASLGVKVGLAAPVSANPSSFMVMLAEGTHHMMPEKCRLPLFKTVQRFLDEADYGRSCR